MEIANDMRSRPGEGRKHYCRSIEARSGAEARSDANISTAAWFEELLKQAKEMRQRRSERRPEMYQPSPEAKTDITKILSANRRKGEIERLASGSENPLIIIIRTEW